MYISPLRYDTSILHHAFISIFIALWAVIDCNKGNVTFHVNGNEHTVHFPRKQPQVHSINSIGKNSTITIGGFEFPLPTVKKKYDILIVGDMHIPVEVT